MAVQYDEDLMITPDLVRTSDLIVCYQNTFHYSTHNLRRTWPEKRIQTSRQTPKANIEYLGHVSSYTLLSNIHPQHASGDIAQGRDTRSK